MKLKQKLQIFAAWVKQLFSAPRKVAIYQPQTEYRGEDDDSSYNGYCENPPLVEVPLSLIKECFKGITRAITRTIDHSTATPEGRYHDGCDVDRWHRELGKNGMGYNILIGLTGKIYLGRPLNVIGAHARNHNFDSIGIAYVGGMTRDMRSPKDTRTPQQKEARRLLQIELENGLGALLRQGHNDVANTACPSFKVAA